MLKIIIKSLEKAKTVNNTDAKKDTRKLCKIADMVQLS